MRYLTKQQTADIFKTYGGSEKNTGSIEGQIALLTTRIKSLSAHVGKNKKDFSTQRGLLKLVGRRKKLLAYLQNTRKDSYIAILSQFGLRR